MATVLNLNAVYALVKEPFMREIMDADDPRSILAVARAIDHDAPEWIEAAFNCKNDEDVLPVAIHTFLMNWKPLEES